MKHAQLIGWVAELLERFGWEVHAEVTYAVWGERGSVDILAWHAATRTLLVVEVKTALVSVEETLRRHDAKQRLAAEVAAERFGWDRPAAVCRLLVLPDRTTTRRHVARHGAVLDRAYRLRADDARRWLRAPAGGPSILLFAPVTRGVRVGRNGVSRRRVGRARLAGPGRQVAPRTHRMRRWRRGRRSVRSGRLGGAEGRRGRAQYARGA
jgi:Holliday junction resolvase-like predicted endonuclease